MDYAQQIKAIGWTNQILIHRHKEAIIYFIPCYLRLIIKNFISISIENLEAQINADLIFSLYYGDIPFHIYTLLKQNIVIQFNRNEAIKLESSLEVVINKMEKQRILTFTIRKNLKTFIDCNLFWSPFELIRLQLVATIRSIIHFQKNSNLQQIIRFNLMDHPNLEIKISHTNEISAGNYTLANGLLKVQYLNHLQQSPDADSQSTQMMQNEDLQASQKQINEEQEHQHGKIQYFQYAIFKISMYKHPFNSLFTLLLPMWSLAIYNLFIYFSGNDMTMRISNGVTIDLALFAFLPTVRTQLPDTPKILLIEILMYLIAITFHLTIIQGYLASLSNPSTYSFDWTSNVWFLLSLCLTLLTFVITLVISIMHKFKWEPSYHKIFPKKSNKFKLVREQWSNHKCDSYFKKFNCLQIQG